MHKGIKIRISFERQIIVLVILKENFRWASWKVGEECRLYGMCKWRGLLVFLFNGFLNCFSETWIIPFSRHKGSTNRLILGSPCRESGEAGNGEIISLTRAKKGVFALDKVLKGPKRAKNDVIFTSRSLIYGIYCDYQKSRPYGFRGNNSEWSQVPRKPQD